MFSFSQRCLLYLFFPLPAVWFRSGRQTPQPESTGAVKDQNRVGGGDHPCEVQQHHPDLGRGATRGEAADHELQRQDRKVVLCFSIYIYIYIWVGVFFTLLSPTPGGAFTYISSSSLLLLHLSPVDRIRHISTVIYSRRNAYFTPCPLYVSLVFIV